MLHEYMTRAQERQVVQFWRACPGPQKLHLIDEQVKILQRAESDRFIIATKLLMLMISFGASSKIQRYILA